jgi:hypothetical protein
VLGYELDDRKFKSRQGPGIFLFTTASRQDLKPTQLPIQRVAGAISLVVKGPGLKMTTHHHLVPRSGMCGATPSIPQYAPMAWCSVKAEGPAKYGYSEYKTIIDQTLLQCYFYDKH